MYNFGYVDILPVLYNVVGKFPSTWEGNTLDTKLVTLSTSSHEYTTVKQGFESTVKGRKIIRMERVQNHTLYAQYAARKNLMDQTNPPGTVNERKLYHGCPGHAVQGIVHQGLNRMFAGRAVGKGCYF